jgi:hypothetical protein
MPKPPIPLRNAVDIAELCRTDPCDDNRALGSFWPNSRTSFESRLVKAFKACSPMSDFEPHISALCKFYARLVVDSLDSAKPDWVVRVLGSRETDADPSRPQSALGDMICSMTGARSGADLFFKSEARPPMRVVNRLAGSEALKARLQYVVQDLFVRPGHLGGSVLLIDDIANTGASMRVYAFALKELMGASRVCAINLAATRFSGGKDGRGMLRLKMDGLADCPSLSEVWVDESKVLHARRDCPSASEKLTSEVRFIAQREAAPCPVCTEKPPARRRWWQLRL